MHPTWDTLYSGTTWQTIVTDILIRKMKSSEKNILQAVHNSKAVSESAPEAHDTASLEPLTED